MRMLIGLEEISGPKNNPLIMRWVKDIGAPPWFDNDDKAWCAVGYNRNLMACQLPMARHPDPTKRDGFDLLRAATFEHYGEKLALPIYGCIATFSRPEGDHVASYLGENKVAYRVLGCNQKDSVSITWIKKERSTGFRWPTGVPTVGFDRLFLTEGGELSANES